MDLVLMGRAMLCKYLIQFSADGWGCVPSLLFTWGQTMVEVVKIMALAYSSAKWGIKMGSIKDRNGMDLTEAEDIKKRWQEYMEELYKKDLHDSDNHDL